MRGMARATTLPRQASVMAGVLALAWACIIGLSGLGVAVLARSEAVAAGRATGGAADNLIQNGIMQVWGEAPGDNQSPLAAWKSYVWSGQGTVPGWTRL